MWLFVIAGAVAVDAFATGMWIGKKWGTSSVATAVGADLAAVEAKVAPVVSIVEGAAELAVADVSKVVSALEADVAALRAKVSPAPQVAPAVPVITGGTVVQTTNPVLVSLASQAATAPK